jgi:hypothetical protein
MRDPQSILAALGVAFLLGYLWSGTVRRILKHRHDPVIRPEDHPRFIRRA